MPGNQARKAVQRRETSDKQCKVPGCKSNALIDEEGDVTDCCYDHSLGNSDAENSLPNDGFIDWVAIEVAATGARRVRLTWVEKDIAFGRILASGGTFADAERNLGIYVQGARQHEMRRVKAAQAIAKALESTRKEVA